MNPPAVRFEGVSRAFRRKLVLKSIDLTIEKSDQIFLLGSNGAGKTTLLRIAATLLKPSEGRVEFFGRDGGYRKTKKVDPGFEQRYAKLLATTDEAQQEKLTQDLDKYVYDRADLLFLYAPAKLYAVSKRVNFVPYKTTMLELAETSLAKEVASQR